MDEAVAFGSKAFFAYLAVLALGRGMDLLSTWVATPTLMLEGNPVAKRLGWKGGLLVNLTICVVFARWPLAAIIIATTSALVAARNFQLAWLTRSHGEENYRAWFGQRLVETPPTLFIFCLLAQTLLVGAVGGAVAYFSGLEQLVVLGIGFGIIGYATAVLLFTLLALWRSRRVQRLSEKSWE